MWEAYIRIIIAAVKALAQFFLSWWMEGVGADDGRGIRVVDPGPGRRDWWGVVRTLKRQILQTKGVSGLVGKPK